MNSVRRLQAVYDAHPAFMQVLALFIVFRMLAALFLQPGGFLIPWSPDQLFYHAIGTMAGSGLYPYLNYWMEFPPLFPYLVVASYKVSLLIPSASNIYWFNAILRFLMLPFEAGSLVLVYRIVGQLRGIESARRTSAAFALLFAPLFAFLGWFDSVVLFFVLLALHGLAYEQPLLTGLGIGLGFGVKLFPIAALPAAVQAFRSPRSLVKLMGTVAGSVAAVFLPFFALSPTYTLAFFRTLAGRTSWETVWALMEGYTGWGAVAPLSIRDDPATTAWVPDGYVQSNLPWLWITLAFSLIGLWLWTRRIDWHDPIRSTAFAGLTFGIMLLYAKGYSPQWGIYLSTLAVVLLPGGRGVWYGILLSILTGLEWPFAFQVFPDGPAFLAGVIVARTAVMLLLCVEFAGLVYTDAVWLQSAVRPLPVISAAAIGITALMVAIPLFRQYEDQRLTQEPFAPVITGWRLDQDTPQVAILTQPAIRERLDALVPAHVAIYPFPNAFADPWAEPADWLKRELPSDAQVVWFLYDQSAGEYENLNTEMLQHLREAGCELWDDTYGTSHAAAFLNTHPEVQHMVSAAYSDSGKLLESYGLEIVELPHQIAVCLSLTWETSIEPYEVRVEILQDGTPVIGVARSPQGLQTTYGLIAPLPPGQYGIAVALADPSTGEVLHLGEGDVREELTSFVVED